MGKEALGTSPLCHTTALSRVQEVHALRRLRLVVFYTRLCRPMDEEKAKTNIFFNIFLTTKPRDESKSLCK